MRLGEERGVWITKATKTRENHERQALNKWGE